VPLTRNAGGVVVNGCATFACGVESATDVHPPLTWWRHDTMEGAPDAEVIALTGGRRNILVSVVNSRCVRSPTFRKGSLRRSPQGELRGRAPQRGLAREAHRDSRRSVHGADAGVPLETRGSVRGRFISGKGSSSPKKTRGVGIAAGTTLASPQCHHGERGASERVCQSGCFAKATPSPHP